ncbi:MAG: reductase [Verrucomicrobia bacterium]|nr:reductase [Verrucomicrobiota bacterium]
MANPIRILAFSGSARRESLNRKLLAVAVQATRDAGAEVTLLDLNDFELPLYHGDLEDAKGMPENATKLVNLIIEHQGLLIASPEYNSMFTPLLKNTLDWCTRADDSPFPGKVAAVVSASPGILGGVRSMQHARHLLLHLGCHVVPAQCMLSKAHEAFDDQGKLKDPKCFKTVQTLATQLVETTRKLTA